MTNFQYQYYDGSYKAAAANLNIPTSDYIKRVERLTTDYYQRGTEADWRNTQDWDALLLQRTDPVAYAQWEAADEEERRFQIDDCLNSGNNPYCDEPGQAVAAINFINRRSIR